MPGTVEPPAPDEVLELSVQVARPERLDRFVAAACVASRASVQRWIKEGHVMVDGAAVLEPSSLVRTGSVVRVRPLAPPPSDAVPQDIPLSVLHEDSEVIVVDKPAGLVVHPAAGHPTGTLVNALLHRFGPLPRGADEDDEEAPQHARPGIVHRLDRFTSGVMVVARTEAARDALMRQFSAHSIERVYLALVQGEPPREVTYATLHGRHPTDRKRFTTRVRTGKRAVTHVRRLASFAGASLVACTLETGRTHQIRVHLSEAGFPLLGDPVYGKPALDKQVRALSDGLGGRQALHASVLGFDTLSSTRLRFESPLPSDLAGVLAALRGRDA